MSTLKVNNLQDVNGANNSTPQQVAQGRAKAWVNFDGTSVTSTADLTGVRDSFNVSSVVDNGTGDYTVSFSSAMPNANYAFTFGSGLPVNSGHCIPNVFLHAPTTTNIRITVFNTTNSNLRADDPKLSVAIFGD